MVTRIALTLAASYPLGVTGVGFSVLREQSSIVPLAVWSGLGGLWIVIGFAVYRSRGLSLLLVASVAASLLVADTTRSLSYLLPAVLVALRLLRGNPWLETLAAVSAVVSLVAPTIYVEGARIWIL